MSTAVMSVVPRLFSPVLLRALAPVLAILASSGCLVPDNLESGDPGNTAGEGEGEGTDEGTPEFSGGICATPTVDDDGTVCGGCDFGGGDICGTADVAICEARENSDGQGCELCLTATGVVLYDDCFRAAVDDTVVCEASPADNADVTCRTCFDDVGNAVSSSCTPRADRCETDVEVDGRLCNQCYRADVLVSTVCAPTDLTPRRCMAYDNDVGRCVDCYDDADVLLTHDCSPVSDGAACEDRIQGGLLCTVCTDNTGQVTSQECRDELPERARCERLEFSEQSCVMCAGVDDDVTFVKCADVSCTDDNVFCRDDSGCDDGEVCFDGLCVGVSSGAEGEPSVGACVEPPRCVTSTVDGDLCRTCPTTSGATETRCMSTSNLTCAAVDEALLPAATDNVVGELPTDGPESPSDRPAPQGRSCVVCTDSDVDAEVYRDCAVPPPYCLDRSTVDGDVCSVCYDAVTNAVVYSACANDTCFDQRDIALHDDDGAAVLVDRAAAVAACKQCSDGDVTTTSCALRARCDDGLTADADACATATTSTTTLRLQPHRCNNPWTAWRNTTDRADDLAGLMSWASSEHRLVIDAATTAPAAASCANDSCGCPRGDVVTIVIAAGDTALAERAFAGFLAP